MASVAHDPHRLRLGRLTVLHDPVPGPLTALAVAVRAGSRYDGAHPGMAHLVEHMLFQGTQRLDQVALNRRAAELGGQHDADTGHEDIVFHFEVFNEDVDDALALLAEQLFASTLPADRLAKERRVIADEIRGHQDDPAGSAHEHAWRRFFGEPLGHPVCGTMTSVRHIDHRALQAFVARHFVPANMVLAASGGVRRERLRRAVRRAFPTDGPPPCRRPRLGVGRRTGVLRLSRRELTQAHVVRLMAVPAAPRPALAVSIAMEIVGADPDARLFQEVRERLGLGYDLAAGVDQGADWAVAIVSASAAREDAMRLREAIDGTCREAGRGFSAEEVARARKKIRYRFVRLADSRQERAASHAERALGGLPTLAASARLLDAITPHEIDAAWRRLLAAPTLTVVLAG